MQANATEYTHHAPPFCLLVSFWILNLLWGCHGALWWRTGQSGNIQRLQWVQPQAQELEAPGNTQLHSLAYSLDVSALTGSNPAHSGFTATEGHCLAVHKNQLPSSSMASQPFK